MNEQTSEAMNVTLPKELFQRLSSGLKNARATIDRLEREPIAIIGMSCRFPGGANNLEQFWQLLREGRDAVSEVPDSRWQGDDYYDPTPGTPGKAYTKEAAFLEHPVTSFDPLFFGISPVECQYMDPQQRLLLEVVWEALEDAGLPANQLPRQTGMFIGIADLSRHAINSDNDVYGFTGHAASVAAGRLSYILGLQGPTMSIDTACSSSLVALHLACQSLRAGECEVALSGGVNIIISPEGHIMLSAMQAISPDGRCKTFSAQADGYGRGEGCGVVVLKRLSDAVAAGDRIWAVIRGSAVNHDGPSSGLTVPNKEAQVSLIRQALAKANVKGEEVGYVEAHGTGTKLGDPIEVRALADALGERDERLYIGSVKTNIGHLEAGAGISGVIKSVLALYYGEIPPHLHFNEPNSLIDWDNMPFEVPTELTAWPFDVAQDKSNGKQPRIAGVSSFGISGTNAHVIISEWQDTESTDTRTERSRPTHLLTLSGKSEAALADQVSQYLDYLSNHAELPLGDVCYTTNTGRVHFEHRLGVVATDIAEVQAKLKAHQQGEPVSGLAIGQAKTDKPKVAFLFPGQGPQYVDMGRELYDTQPLFRGLLDECDAILRNYWNQSLLDILYGEDRETADKLLDEATYAQPALFAIEYALAKLWQSWGIEPEVVIGHSMGEYAACCFAGVFSLADGLKLVAERGRLMQQEAEAGQMVAVLASVEEVEPVIEPFASEVSIGVINTSENLVISGRPSGVEKAVKALETAGLETRQLKIYVASHSPLMEGILDKFEAVVESISKHPPQIKVVSNLTGTVVSEELTTLQYWRDHLRESVQFAQGMATLAELGIDTFIEVGPKPTLLGLGQQCLADPSTSSGNGLAVKPVETNQKLWLPSLYPKQSGDWAQLLASLGQFHVRGGQVDWATLHEPYGYRKVSLPTYPFQRKRYWIDRPLRQAQGTSRSRHPLLGDNLVVATSQEIVFETKLSADYPAYLGDHQVYEQVVVPAAAYLEMALSASHQIAEGEPFELHQISFQQPLVLPVAAGTQKVQLVASPNEAGYQWQIFSQGDSQVWQLHVQGEVVTPEAAMVFEGLSLKTVQDRCSEGVSLAEYEASVPPGLYFGPDFQGLEQLFRGENEALGLIQLPDNLSVAEYQLHPVLLDCCLRVGGIIKSEETDSPHLPFSCEVVRLYQASNLTRVWSHVQSRGEVAGTRQLDITLYDEAGQVVAELIGFGLRQVNRQAITGSTLRTDWLYQLDWQPAKLPSQSPYQDEPGHWLIVSEPTDLAQDLVEQLRSQGEQVDQLSTIHDSLFTNHNPLSTDYRGVIYLAHKLTIRTTTPQVPETALAISTQVLELVQALIETEMTPDLWLITTDNVAESVLWGLGRTLMWEYPQLKSRCLEMTGETTAETLFETIWYADTENQIALRQGRRHIARLERYKQDPKGFGNPLGLDKDRSYLITGGLGALGLKVAEWLVNQGATHVVLSSRRGAASETAQTMIAELEAQGATVQVVKADVSNEEEVKRLLAESQKEVPLAGIIHAAGVLDDGILLEQTPERFAKVFAPKVQGSWYLHQYSQHIPLDFFVCFSSMASLLGNGGQTNYAAANAFMDALVAYRQAEGLPGLSINWGGWSEIGLAKELVAQQGEGISPEQGIDLFGALLSHSTSSGQAQKLTQVGVIQVNWSRFSKQLPSTDSFPVLSNLIKPKQVASQTSLRHQLSQASAEEGYEILKRHINSEVELIVGVVPTDEQGLFDLGMDSLMSIQLANRLSAALQITLPATLLINNNSLNSLSHVLWKLLGAKSTTKRPDDEIIIRQAVVADAPQIVKLFKSIQITPANLSKKLDETHPNRYSRTGGFFEIFSEEQMREFIEQSGYLVDLAFYKDELVAYISLIVEPSLVYKKWQQLIALEKKLDEERVATFVENFKQQKVAYPMEIVISPTYQFSDLTQLLYQRVYNYLTERGFTHTFSETYNIIYNDLEYKNPNSDLVQTLTGSEIIGYVMKAFVIDGKKIDVKSNIHIGQLET